MNKQENDMERSSGQASVDSEFIRQVQGFGHYVSEEYIADTGTRAILVCCYDADTPVGPGGLVMGYGRPQLVERAVSSMLREERLRGMLLRVAKEAGDGREDYSGEISRQKSMLRKEYVLAGLNALWTLCLVVIYAAVTYDLITLVSNMLLMVFVHMLVWRDILTRRRRIKELAGRGMQDCIDRIRGRMKEIEAFMADMRRRMDEEDDDDDY